MPQHMYVRTYRIVWYEHIANNELEGLAKYSEPWRWAVSITYKHHIGNEMI